ncbi:hypothetical protein GCM10023224_46350 [Streptomonospora halophila]|uniref:DNA-directed RNA polymerase specialized sigma subunit, sigma24 family n=1 Tax=Streptomonospora halophila TaxID=427369 RepID=A0ABP9GYY5_9ACTN
MAGRHSAAPGAELAAALRGGAGYGRCYDLFADQLYRYCWSLVGPGGGAAEPDRAAAALHETFLAAADRIHALRDDREFAAWLFALVRTAARRRGFAPRSPYAELATTENEQAAVRLSQRLPPSHRELLELYLRHGLPTPLIARVLGLGAETAAELCRTAVLHAADQLARYARAPEQPEGRGTDRGVRAVLAELEPPGPPPGLRERVLQDCASPLARAERRAAAYALAPLGDDGFPLHRNRTPATGGAAGAEKESDAFAAAGEDPADPDAGATLLPEDRVTTGDVPARAEPEPLAGPGGAAGTRRRRMPVPVVALLAAAAVMVCLWGVVAAVSGRAGGPVAEAGPAEAPAAVPSAEERPGAASAVSDGPGKAEEHRPGAMEGTSVAPSQEPDGAPPAEPRPSGDPSGAPGSDDGGAAAPSPTAGAPDGGSGQEQGEGGGSAEGPEGGSDSGDSGSEEDSGGSEDGGDGISGLFDGLFGLFSGGGTDPPA